MTEAIGSNPVTIVNLDSMARSVPGLNTLSHIAESAQRLQSSSILCGPFFSGAKFQLIPGVNRHKFSDLSF